jgi:hypothetical protein
VTTATPQAFSLSLPRGFVPLPLSDEERDDAGLARHFADLLGLADVDESSAMVAGVMADFGGMLGSGGLEYAALGLFRSPSVPTRPVSALLTCIRMTASGAALSKEIAALMTIHQEQGAAPEVLTLPAGEAVAVVTEEAHDVGTDPASPVVVLNRQVSVWIPEPDGDTIAVVSVASPSWPDWDHICDLALGIVDSFSWEAGAPA